MSDGDTARRQLKLDLLGSAERIASARHLRDELQLAIEDIFPHIRHQRFATPPDVGEQFVLERAWGAELAAPFGSAPAAVARAVAVERMLFPGAALLQAVDSFGLAALDPHSRHGWSVPAGMPRRAGPIGDPAPLLPHLMLILGTAWQHEARRARARAGKPVADGKVLRRRGMIEFIVEALAAAGWPFTAADVRGESETLCRALRRD